MSGQNKNREKEEKLFRALSGVDEELLLRSEQNDGGEKQKANGKIHRFPLHYVPRIAAACLCFMVAGVLYVTMSGTKMADSTSADTAGNECAAPQQVYEAAKAEDTADVPECAVAEVTTDMDGAVTENQQQAAQNSDSVVSVSGNEASGTEDNTEAVKEQEEETLTEKSKTEATEDDNERTIEQ